MLQCAAAATLRTAGGRKFSLPADIHTCQCKLYISYIPKRLLPIVALKHQLHLPVGRFPLPALCIYF